ncbi:MAG: TIGR03086 family metal-binding protein [Nocardioides sp.]
MTATLDGCVGLLDRSLVYTCARLGEVRDDELDRPTPCADWDLADLLAHMDDALDAFTEAAGGSVGRPGDRDLPVSASTSVCSIRAKATALRGIWSRPTPGDVVIEAATGPLDLHTPLLVATAALEVAVHGWDVARATGVGRPVPPELARDLLPMALALVGPADRGVRFAAERPVRADASADVRLLAYLGRT